MEDYTLLGMRDRERWLKELETIKEVRPDLHYRPEYCGLFADVGEAHLFIYREGTDSVLYPFLLRKVNLIPGLAGNLSRDLYDITSPYGYGGPLASPGAGEQVLKNFCHCFARYCQKNGIITEFIRFHPVLGNHRLLEKHLAVEKVSSAVVVDLKNSAAEIWAGYERNNRKNINKAYREGLKVVLESSPHRFADFLSIYHHTLSRNQASGFYYFSGDFYDSVHRDLKGNYIYAHTLAGGRVISTELLLYNGTYVHSFLGGTLEAFFDLRPNNILKHEVIQWAKARGISFFLLGGGYREGDGIFRYKRSFASGGVLEYHVGKKIHDHAAVSCLKEIIADGRQRESKEYFPPYRRC